MKHIRPLALLLHATALATLCAAPPLDATKPLERIAFGSCNNQDKPQPTWDGILNQTPQMFIFLGDNIYGDSADMGVLKAKYAKLASIPGFKKLRETTPIYSTWDDHDYGMNDAGSEYTAREASHKLFLEFWNEPADSPRWKRPGVYNSYTFGPEGKRVQLILLDTRYFRTPHNEAGPGRKTPGTHALNDQPTDTMLGEAQWKWLGEELKKPAQVRLIGSSVQVLADFHGIESWADFPLEREKLLNLIDTTGAGGVIFLSGDVHWAEFAKLDRPGKYPLYDMTCSGMTHVIGGAMASKQRVGKAYTKLNFGTIEFDWSGPDPKILMTIRDQIGVKALEQEVPLSTIQPKR